MLLERLPYDTCINCYALHYCNRADGTNTVFEKDCCYPYSLLVYYQGMSNIPPLYRNAVMPNFNGSIQRTDFMNKIVNDILDTIDRERVNFVFYGERSGTGKTYCGCVILNHYNIACIKRDERSALAKDRLYAYYVDFAGLINSLRSKYNDGFDEDLYETIKNVPLLMLDDVGSGKMSEFAQEQVNILFNHRQNYQLSTIITTNLSIDALKSDKGIGSRAYDRIHSNAYIKKFAGESNRTNRLE